MFRKALLLMLLAGLCYISVPAQTGNAVLRLFPGVPTGACSSIMLGINNANGDYYSCWLGAWVKVGPSVGGSSFYQTMQDEGLNLPQEPKLNFLGANIVCADNPGLSTDCTITSSGTGTVTHTGALALNQLVFGNGAADIAVGDLTGDVSTSGGKATTLATVAAPATNTKITYDAKGRVTSGGAAACADLSDDAPSCNTDTTNATNISSGTLPAARMPALTGDVTSTVNTVATTIAANAVTQSKVSGGYVDLTNAQNPIAGNKTFSGNVSALSFQFTRRMVDEEAGADFGAKLNNCIVNITNGLNGAFGGICDATNIQGFQAAAAPITFNHDNVTILLPCNVVLTLAGSPGISWTNSSGGMFGCGGMTNTIITTSSATADIIAIGTGASRNSFSNFVVQSAVARSAGSGIRVSGGDNDFERIWINPTFNGISLDTAATSGGNTFRGMRFGGGGSGAAWNCMVKTGGIATGNVASNSFAQTVMFSNGGTIADAMWCIQDGSDSIDIIGGQAVANLSGGVDATALHLERVAAGNPPSNIRIVDLTMEGGPTKPAVVIDSAFGVECTGCTAQSSLQGLLANSGTRIKWSGGLFFNNQQEGVRDNNVAVTDLQVLGARFCNNSLATNNTFSDFFAVAGTTGFSVEHNRFLACQAGGNAPKNNVEIAAGASNNYYINDNTLSGSVGAAILDGGTGTSKRICNIGIGCTFDNFVNKYGQADTQADSGALNTTETIIVKTPALVANRLIAGTHIRMTLTGTCTASAANTSTFTIRMGTLGTTGDTAIATPVTAVSAITGTNIPFKAVFDFTIRTTGASGTGFITMELVNQGITGISTLGDQIIMPTMSTFNTTTAANILSVSYKSAATTTTSTFKQGVIEIVQN